MRRPNLESRILIALKDNAKSGETGMDKPGIRVAIFGEGYTTTNCPPSLRGQMRSTEYQLEKAISQRMGAVIELAASEGLIVFAKLKSCNPKTPKVKSRIVEWRIYDPKILGMNESLLDAAMFSKKHSNGHSRTTNRLLDAALKNGAISEKKYKELIQ